MNTNVLADLSVNVKVLAAVGVAALVALIVGISGLLALSDASASAQLIYRSNVASIDAVGRSRPRWPRPAVDLANQALSQDAAGTAKFTDAVTARIWTRSTQR